MKKNNNKQNNQERIKISERKKRNFQIIIFTSSVILLVFVLIGILKINTIVKSESNKMMKQFEEYYSSDEMQIIYYYSSVNTDDDKAIYELEYLLNIKKNYDIDYLDIDMSKLSDKNRTNIESSLGIEGNYPTIAIVKNKQIVAIQEGFIESNKLVQFFIDVNILDKSAKYKDVDNLKFIDYSDYKKILKNDKKNIVVIGEAGCKYCMAAKPILNNISKAYKVDINYLDLSDLKQEDLKDLFDNLEKYGYDNEEFIENNNFNLPTILIIKKGKITSYIEGVKTLEEYIDYFKENDTIE